MFSRLSAKNCFLALLGAAIQAVGVCNIHAYSGVTEGGVLGATLLIQHWLHISPAVSSLLLNTACYLLGWRTLGTSPLLCAVIGAVFVGVGAGLSVRAGGAPGGDDALAMSLSRILKWDIQWVYLFSDLVVLALSATYIPWQKLGYSLLTVLLSGQIIGWVQKIGRRAA